MLGAIEHSMGPRHRSPAVLTHLCQDSAWKEMAGDMRATELHSSGYR